MKNIFYQIIYNPTINLLIRNINKLFFKNLYYIPVSGKVKFNYDELTFFIHTNQTNYITKLLYYEECKNYEYSSIFRKLIMNCEVFFDIGVNTGYYSILGTIANPKLKVYGFEPAIGSLYYLKESIKSNRLENRIEIIPIALSDNTGIITFNDVFSDKYKGLIYNLAGVSSTAEIHGTRPFRSYDVNCDTLDNFVSKSNVNKIDLIKIDTEGTEDLILSKGSQAILTNKPIIICETLFNRIETKLNDIMISYGYEFYNHTENGLQKVDNILRETDNGITNCFFVHPDKKHLIEEFLCK